MAAQSRSKAPTQAQIGSCFAAPVGDGRYAVCQVIGRLDRIGTREVEAFKARRKNDGIGPKSINEELAILSKILGYAEETGDLTTRPPKIRRLKVPKPDFDFLDFDEAKRLEVRADVRRKERNTSPPR